MNTQKIADIQKACSEHKIVWTNHILIRLLQRGILQQDVENAIMTGEIIEQYPDDYPNPSCLILGVSLKDEVIHVVCGLCEGTVWMITAYIPDLTLWESDFKTRKNGGTE